MGKLRAWGFASVGCRVWALFAAVSCVQMIIHDQPIAAIFTGIIFGLAWHASEIAKWKALDLLSKADKPTEALGMQAGGDDHGHYEESVSKDR